MTCREKWKNAHPGLAFDLLNVKCPWHYGYLEQPDYCTDDDDVNICVQCWNREIPEETKKENSMSTEKTKAELMEEIACLEKQVNELEKYKAYRDCGDELKALHTEFMNAGFSNEQAFSLMQTMLVGSMSENMVRDLRKVARR